MRETQETNETTMVGSEELQQILAELQRTRERLARAEGLITLGHMAAQATHKLNSYLAVIQGYAQLLLEEDLDDETKATIGKIDKEAQKAAEVVARLADLAKQTREGGSVS
jgi:signal transduction histidine kinase